MHGEPLTILLVEDNPDHADLVMRSLEDHKMSNKIFHVSDGEAAIDYLQRKGEYSDPQSSPVPHVVLLDLRLPKVDGLEVLKIIREDEKLSHLPVVVLTTSNGDKDVAQAYKHRANSYVVKPLDFACFAEMMKDLGFFWLCWNHNPWIPEE
ncbi:MAG: response regulator [Magnetovibrio sp.]|nr:response regulator [Magnetovibrio sp.]